MVDAIAQNCVYKLWYESMALSMGCYKVFIEYLIGWMDVHNFPVHWTVDRPVFCCIFTFWKRHTFNKILINFSLYNQIGVFFLFYTFNTFKRVYILAIFGVKNPWDIPQTCYICVHMTLVLFYLLFTTHGSRLEIVTHV